MYKGTLLKKTVFGLLLLLVLQVPGVFAHDQTYSLPQSSGSLIDQLNENLRKQQELKNKITAAKEQEKSLSSDIVYLENQIELTQLEIEETKTRLTQLGGDIDDVSSKLSSTKDELEYTNSVANSRLEAIYKQSFLSSFGQFFGSSNFNDFLTKQKYAEVIRGQDLQLLSKLESLKDQYADQKTILEDKKKKEESLKADLEIKTNSLAGQQSSKQYILGVTKNNEQEYQRLLSQVQGEIAAISRALGGGRVRLGRVNRGDVVAFQGNSGCSTGTHVHFGLYIGRAPRNPKPYLDSGALRWPENSPTVTQWFGANYWWYWTNFGMPGHNGIDMTAGWGAPIYAAGSGTAYLSTDSAPCWLTGTLGKGIVIDHDNGWQTIYWHIQ